MATGYPIGAILGGSIASVLLISGGWRDIFMFGAIVSGVFLPLSFLLLPESIGFLLQKRPLDALDRVNAVLRRMVHPQSSALPFSIGKCQRRPSPRFSTPPSPAQPSADRVYFVHIMTFYFILKWVPKIVVDMGYAPAAAGGVLVWANGGDPLGALLLSVLNWRLDIRIW